MPSVVVSDRLYEARPWTAETLADVDCAVILTHHDEFVEAPLWRDSDALVVDTRNVAGEARGGVFSL